MNRRFLFLGLAALAVVAILAFGFWGGDGGNWRNHEQITRIVPGENGETLIIEEGGHNRGFFPFFPFFFFIPVIWFLVIGGVFSAFGRRRWGGEPPFGPRPDNREAWLADWHQRQHSTQPYRSHPLPNPPESPDTPSQ